MNLKAMNYFSRLMRQPQTESTVVREITKSTCDKAMVKKPTFVVAYLVSQHIRANPVQALAELFSISHASLDYHIADNPLFFKFEEALQYLRFMGDNNKVILKAVIPQYAVEGRYETLHVRSELIKVKHIYSGYASLEANHSVINPCFDQNILVCLKENEHLHE